jgi:hypothetical protein
VEEKFSYAWQKGGKNGASPFIRTQVPPLQPFVTLSKTQFPPLA